MIYHTSCKNLREYNAQLRAEGEKIQYHYAGYMQSSGIGAYHETRHYIAEITKGENAGATTGDYIEIVFNSPYGDTVLS